MPDMLRYPKSAGANIANGGLEIADAGYMVADPATTDLATLSQVGVKGFYFVYGQPTFADRGQQIEGIADGYIRDYTPLPPQQILLYTAGEYIGPSASDPAQYQIPTQLIPHDVHGIRTNNNGSYSNTGHYADVSTGQFVKGGPFAVIYDTENGDNAVYVWLGPIYFDTLAYYYADPVLSPIGWTEQFYISDASGTPLPDPSGQLADGYLIKGSVGARGSVIGAMAAYYNRRVLSHAYEYAAGFCIGWPSNAMLPDTCLAAVGSDDNPCNVPNVPPLPGSTGYGPGANNYVAAVPATWQTNEPHSRWAITAHDASGQCGNFVPYDLAPHNGKYNIPQYQQIFNAAQGGQQPDPLSDPPINLTVGGNVVGVLQCGDAVFLGPQATYTNLKNLHTNIPITNFEQETNVRFVCRQKHTNSAIPPLPGSDPNHPTYPPTRGILNDYWNGKLLFAYLDLDPQKPVGGGGGGGGKPLPSTPIGIDMLSTRTGMYVALSASVLRAPTAFQSGFVGSVADKSNDCNMPQLLEQEEASAIVLVYRRGTGQKLDATKPPSSTNKDDPYFWLRRTSYDLGATWTQELDSHGQERHVKDGVKWVRQVLNRRTRETLVFYNDGSGKSIPSDGSSKDPQPDGTGLLMADIYDVTGLFVGTFPADGKGIAGKTADDAAFDPDAVRDRNHDLRLVFLSGGKTVYCVSVDEGRTWTDISSQLSS